MTRIRADRRAGLLLGGVVLMTFVALGATVALPAADPAVRSTKGARSYSRLERSGMKLYRSEGCWYCHTEQVRNTSQDAAYGKPLSAAAYAKDAPPLLGLERIGPDLTHVGGRITDATEMMAYLRNPGAKGKRTAMPSYAYMSRDDLRALTAYLLSLE